MKKMIQSKKFIYAIVVCTALILTMILLVGCNSVNNAEYGIVLSSSCIGNRSGAVEFFNLEEGYYIEIYACDVNAHLLLDDNGNPQTLIYFTQNKELWNKTVARAFWENSKEWTKCET